MASPSPKPRRPPWTTTESGKSDVRRRVAASPRVVLLVDDDDDFIGPLVPALSTRGHEVWVAATGAQAREIVAERRIDVAIVDGLLPDCDGVTLISQLRRPGIEFVFVSAFQGLIESARRVDGGLGVAMVVHKPVDVESLCDRLDHPERERAGASAATKSLSVASSEYARSLPSKLQEIAALVRQAKVEPASSFVIDELRSRAHRLAGTAASYGYPEVSEAAAAIEEALTRVSDERLRALAWSVIDGAVNDAAAVAERAVRAASRRRGLPVGVGGARLLVVDGDPLFLGSLEEVSQTDLFDVVRATAADAISVAESARPDAVLVSMETPSSAASLDLPRALRALPGAEALPIALVSRSESADDRLRAARTGASLVLSMPVDAAALGLAVQRLVASRPSDGQRVLFLHEDLASSRALASLLQRRGMHVVSVVDTSRLLTALEQTRPDAIVVDNAAADALDVCTIVRQSPIWRDVPVLVLSKSGASSAARLETFRAGADDVLEQPADPEEIAIRLAARVDRMRALRERFDKDVLTDLPLRRPFLEHLTRAMAESLRHARPLTLALLDVDGFKTINDRHGHDTGDHVLAMLGRLLGARFRAEDLRGRWGGDEFAIAFVGQTPDAMHGVLAAVLDELASISFLGRRDEPFSVSFSAGMSDVPGDGASVHALLEAADARLYRAKRSGRGRVISRARQG